MMHPWRARQPHLPLRLCMCALAGNVRNLLVPFGVQRSVGQRRLHGSECAALCEEKAPVKLDYTRETMRQHVAHGTAAVVALNSRTRAPLAGGHCVDHNLQAVLLGAPLLRLRARVDAGHSAE